MSEEDVGVIREELRAATETIRSQQRSVDQFALERPEPIAIVGVGLRFPGGNDTLEGFDGFLRAGRSGIRPLPRERWDVDAFSSADPKAAGTISTKAGGFLDRIDEFDAQFFNISPKHAPYIDPQQRLLLETAWSALEHANIDPTPLRHGNGGVYIGASPLDFALELDALGPEQLDGNLATGLGAYSLSGRLSYFLGWRGPSLTTDTACASSLTALHLAVEGLRRRECDIALCGAVNALHNPRSFVILSQGQMLAPDGRCKTFDDAADGYARAEGCGVLVLKRLCDAWLADDTVLAIVRGTAIGQDGESAGLTAPNGTAQEAVMRAALASCRLEPGDIQYVEAHGTGTPLGDPIEMSSINAVFGAAHRDGERITVGSLKSNVGHMEPAAGVGGILKVIAQLRAGMFYPNLLDTPSGRIPWDTYPVTVPRECRPWQARVRRAIVNGFGVTGAIGVAVLEEAPQPSAHSRTGSATPDSDSGDDSGGGHVFTLSAKSEPALRRQVERFRRFTTDHPDFVLADVCYTSNVGRAHFRHRFADAVRTPEQLTMLLDRKLTGMDGHSPGTFRKVALLFTGSGSQHTGMGAALYRQFPEYRARVDECDVLFDTHFGRSIADVMLGRAPDAEAALLETRYAHAALFTLEYALAALWQSWGVRPTFLIGHSVGELVAATVAGVFSLPDGVAFLVARARLIESVPVPGGMAAVTATAASVAPLLTEWPNLAIAAVNSPQQCVVSGGADSLASAVRSLRDRGLTVTPLQVSSPFHSPLIAEISADLRHVLSGIELHEPTMTIISNETGAVASPNAITTPEYWVRHVNQTVNFAAGIATIGDRGRHVFLEIGPSTALTSLARQCLPGDQHRWLASLHPKDTTAATIRTALAGMYSAGLNPRWPRVHSGQRRRRVTLPGYAFDRRRYWLPHGTRGDGQAGHPLHGQPAGETDGTGGAALQLVTRISATSPAYLADHTSNDRVFMPAAAYIEMLLSLADTHFGDAGCPIEDIRFHEAMVLTDQPTEVRVLATPDADGRLGVKIVSGWSTGDGTAERLHLTATLGCPDAYVMSKASRKLLRRLSTVTEPDQVLDAAEVSAAYARAGLDYGPQFSRVHSVARHGADLTVSELSGTAISLAEHLPPPVMDSATHGLAALADGADTYLATSIERVRVVKKPRAERLRAVLQIIRSRRDDPAFTIDVLLLEGDSPVMELSGMGFTRLARPVAGGRAAAGHGRERRAASFDLATLRASSRSGRVSAIAALIRRTVADLLSIDEAERVDPQATFLELGVDSLVAIDLKNVLEARLRLSVPATAVFDQPSIEQLAEFLGQQLRPDPTALPAKV